MAAEAVAVAPARLASQEYSGGVAFHRMISEPAEVRGETVTAEVAALWQTGGLAETCPDSQGEC